MKLQCFSVFDKAVSAFMMPFFVRSKGEAVRSFSDACGDGKHQFCVHPEDYVLFLLGEFDDASGALVPLASAEKVITALECVKVVDA